MKSKSVSSWRQCPYQRAIVHSCHGHRHLRVKRSRMGRPETARTCPEVSKKKNETHHQIRTTLFISSVGTHERKHKCVEVEVLNVPDTVAAFGEKLACQLAAINNTEIVFMSALFSQGSYSHPIRNSCARHMKLLLLSPIQVWLTSNSLLLKPANSFNSSIRLSLEHPLIIPLIMPATPKFPPSPDNAIWPERKTLFLLKCISELFCSAPVFLLSVSQV